MSAVPTSQATLLRQLRRTNELEVARQIGRVTVTESDFDKAVIRIAELALQVSGVLLLEIAPAPPLLSLLGQAITFGGDAASIAGKGSAVAAIQADGKNWGELRIYFGLQPAALESPLRFAKFVAQQIGVAAVLADLRQRRESLLRKAAHLQNAVAKRKAIQRARALLVHAHKISEDEAFLLLRRYCDESGRSLQQVADAVILGDQQRYRKARSIRFQARRQRQKRSGARIE
jgi:hypothetical protein